MRFRYHLLFWLPFMLVAAGCGLQEKKEKIDKAEKDAAYIMTNLDKPAVLSHFPVASFPGVQQQKLQALVGNLGAKCDWPNRQGKFVDFCSISDNGQSSIAYIYEYFLPCDSLRFIMRYNLEPQEPQLVDFHIEPLEKSNPMIIHPERSLLASQKTQ